jgi:hypothetical protein
MRDPVEFGKSLADLVRRYVSRELLALSERVRVVEERGALPGERGEKGERGDKGEPGARGERGIDGLGFDDLTLALDEDGRTIKLCFVRGDVEKVFEMRLPVVYDRGVYQAERAYQQGDAVTWGGSLWIAQRDTTGKPGDGSPDWRLAVKKGRDGGDAAK